MYQNRVVSKRRFIWISLPLLLLLCLFLFVLSATVIAQEEGAERKNKESELSIISEKNLPYGIETAAYLYASEDSFISSLHPDTNYGSHTTFGMGYWIGLFNAMRPVLRFDVNSLPDNASIINATLYLYQDSSFPLQDADMGFRIQYMKQTWNEKTVTWNNASYLGGDEIGVYSLSNAGGWKTYDFTGPVKAWFDESRSNNGIIFTGDENPHNRYRFFRSHQWQGYRPYLLIDYTQCPDDTPPTASVTALPTWSTDTFMVSWQGNDEGSGIAYYDIQYNINGGSWMLWLSQTLATSDSFSGATNGQQYQFRARAVDKCGNVGNWTGAQTFTNIDTIPPAASVTPLDPYTFSASFPVNWSGDDNPGGSGIANYDVQVRLNGGAWKDWTKNSIITSGQISGAKHGDIYEFRARAKDKAGNIGSYPNGAQANTTVALYSLAIVDNFPTPAISDQLSFTVTWSGVPLPGASIISFDLRFRFNDNPWQTWGNFTGTSEIFDLVDDSVDGIYQFEARANDSLGNIEPWSGVSEAAMIVDRLEPFIEETGYLPLLRQN